MFPLPSPGPVPSPRRAVRVCVRPYQLAELGHRFSSSARAICGSCRRLETAASTVRLNAADPGLAGDGRRAGAPADVIRDLTAEVRRLEQVAIELAAAAVAATEADAGVGAGPGLRGFDGPAFRSSMSHPFFPDLRTVDRLAGYLSSVAVRGLVSGVEAVHEGWDAGRLLWPGLGAVPSSARSPLSTRSSAVEERTGRRRTVGWLGPGSSADPIDQWNQRRNEGRARGVRAVAAALDLTANGHWIRADEIGLVNHGGGAYTVVLPGVTDLSRPELGWNPDHRSVRDLDMAAVDSARSSALADNRYAQVVAEALGHAGVEPGARLTVVGHSYGADTALDLAADRRFNGLRYRVEHVVAAGYHSQPQLRHVPRSTDVLVLQNRRDVVIEVERLGRWAMAPMESLATAVVSGAFVGTGGGARATVVEFNGGSKGAGHHPDNYRRFLQRLGSRPLPAGVGPMGRRREVDRFLAEVGAGPWGRGGRLDAVNVSVPK